MVGLSVGAVLGLCRHLSVNNFQLSVASTNDCCHSLTCVCILCLSLNATFPCSFSCVVVNNHERIVSEQFLIFLHEWMSCIVPSPECVYFAFLTECGVVVEHRASSCHRHGLITSHIWCLFCFVSFRFVFVSFRFGLV